MNEVLQRTATAIGGRDGMINDESSRMTYELRKPIEMDGKEKSGTDPEALFAAGYASCLASAIEYLLSANGVSYDGVTVKATNHLMMVPNKGFQFKLTVETRIAGVSSDVEAEYITKGQAFCPFSRAIKGNVMVENV